MKAHVHLIKHALALGLVISVWDGEAWQVRKSKDFEAILEAADCTDETELIFRDKDDKKVGWALVIDSTRPYEIIADHSDNEWMNAWSALYESEN